MSCNGCGSNHRNATGLEEGRVGEHLRQDHCLGYVNSKHLSGYLVEKHKGYEGALPSARRSASLNEKPAKQYEKLSGFYVVISNFIRSNSL